MQAALHALQGAADEYRPAGIVGGGNAVFGVPPYNWIQTPFVMPLSLKASTRTKQFLPLISAPTR